MFDLECKICFTLMNEDVYLPRMLFCGHTYCSKCLQSILQTTKSCPSCRKSISSENVEDFPVNFYLLEIISTNNSTTRKEQNRAQLLKIKSELEDLKPILHSMNNKMKDAEEQLSVLMDSIDGSLDEQESTDKIKKLVETVKEIAFEINVPNSDIVSGVALRCKDYDSVLHLIEEVQMGIQVKGQKFAAVLRIEGVKKFAKISISENYFFIHAFDTYEDDCDFVTICDLLNGFLKCDKGNFVYGFLELTYRRGGFHRKAIVQVANSTSFLTSKFLKLCIGEEGTSFKGLEYSQQYGINSDKYCYVSRLYYYVNHVIQLKTVNLNLEKCCIYSPSVYFSKKTVGAMLVEPNSCHLTCDENGSLEIIEYYGATSALSVPNVIGDIVDFNGDFAEIFRDATQRKVYDCGIAFKI